MYNGGSCGGVAGVGAALGETPVDGRYVSKALTCDLLTNSARFSITGASRWSSPGHPTESGFRELDAHFQNGYLSQTTVWSPV